jgi:ribosome-associated protein
MTPATEPMTPELLLAEIARQADDKKAVDIVALDLRGIAGYTDYFLICSGGSDRQAKAIHDGIAFGVKRDHEITPRRVEGLTEARWVLMDYLDVVVHIFTPDMRDHYRLESLWGDVPRVELAVGPPEQSVATGR